MVSQEIYHFRVACHAQSIDANFPTKHLVFATARTSTTTQAISTLDMVVLAIVAIQIAVVLSATEIAPEEAILTITIPIPMVAIALNSSNGNSNNSKSCNSHS